MGCAALCQVQKRSVTLPQFHPAGHALQLPRPDNPSVHKAWSSSGRRAGKSLRVDATARRQISSQRVWPQGGGRLISQHSCQNAGTMQAVPPFITPGTWWVLPHQVVARGQVV